MSREYVAVRSSLTRAVYFRSRGCPRNFDSRTFSRIPNLAILSLPGIRVGVGHLAKLMFNIMSRRGTVAATHVAKLPQSSRRGTLTEPAISQRAQNGTNVQRPNPRFAAYRGLQSPSQHHTTARRTVPRLTMNPNGTPNQWPRNLIISLSEDLTGFVLIG